MNWYKTEQKNILLLWHATLPQHAEKIMTSGFIKPSIALEEQTGKNYRGWNFNFLPKKKKQNTVQ